MDAKYKLLEEENKKLRDELIAVKEHLKKYTAPARSKTFYENHKEEILEKKRDPKLKEQRKEINKRAYQKRKEKEQEKEQEKKQEKEQELETI
jgi:hypothetical protein